VNIKQAGSATALHAAATNGHEKAVQTLLRYGADINAVDFYGRTPFICAALMGQCQMMNLLLDHGASMAPPNLPADHSGRHYWYSPIHAALRADKNHRQAVMKFLLLHDADVDLPDRFGDSALHKAISFSDVANVKFLVEHGADINKRGFGGTTSLHAAVEELRHQDRKQGVTGVKEDEEILRYLLDRGPDWTLTDDQGLTPLDWAEEGRCSKKLLRILKKHIASVEDT
jgi:ankyrin repeat protein